MPTNTPDPSGYLIDTSSLSSSISYYANLHPPFKDWVEKQFKDGRWVLLEKVLKECGWGNNPVTNDYPFLREDGLARDSQLAPFSDAYNWIDQYCVDQTLKEERKLTGEQYTKVMKSEIKRRADLHLVFAANQSNGKLGIITEESRRKKYHLFMKIPNIADHEDLNIKCITLPQFMAEQGLKLEFPNLLP